MIFLETEDGKKIYGIKHDQIVCIITRQKNHPHKWVAKDHAGIALVEPKRFRHNLFKILKDIL